MSTRHTHSIERPAQTERRLIRWAPFDDGLANLMTSSQISRLRHTTVDPALLQPRETVLDVGCGTGGVSESLPFPDGTIDVATSSPMMHHLPLHLQVSSKVRTL